jgi:hypothetical protein
MPGNGLGIAESPKIIVAHQTHTAPLIVIPFLPGFHQGVVLVVFKNPPDHDRATILRDDY